MPWGAVASVAGSVIGGLISKDMAGSAAGSQVGAANSANDVQWRMYEQNRKDMEPWRNVGVGGLNRLATLMGIQQNANPLTADQLRTRLLPQYTTTRTPGNDGYYSTIDPTNGEMVQMPIGGNATTAIDENGLAAAIEAELAKSATTNAGDPDFGRLTKNFSMSDFQADPGYNFRLSEGLKAVQNSAAARGSLMSGATLKGIERFGQNLASDEYTNAFNRYQMQNSNLYNRLAGLSGTGQVQSQQMAAQGANAANSIGQNLIGAGNAMAAGRVGGANAITGAIGQGMNFYNQNRLLGALMGGNRGTIPWDTPSGGEGYYPEFDGWTGGGGGFSGMEMGF